WFDSQFFNISGGRRIQHRSFFRQQGSIGIHLERVRYKDQHASKEKQTHYDQGDDGSSLAAQTFLDLGQGQPQETEGNSPILHAVIQPTGGMLADHLQASNQLVGGRRRFKTL